MLEHGRSCILLYLLHSCPIAVFVNRPPGKGAQIRHHSQPRSFRGSFFLSPPHPTPSPTPPPLFPILLFYLFLPVFSFIVYYLLFVLKLYIYMLLVINLYSSSSNFCGFQVRAHHSLLPSSLLSSIS